jgi:hypothetical protein
LRIVAHKPGDFALVVAASPKRKLNLHDNRVTKAEPDCFGIDAVLDTGLTSNIGRVGARPYRLIACFPGDWEARQCDHKDQCASRNSFYVSIFHRSSAPLKFGKCSQANFQTFPVQKSRK